MFLRDKLSTVRITLDERIKELENECIDTHKKLSQAERGQYDLQTQLDLTISDMKLVKQDIAVKTQELANVHSAFENMEREKQGHLKRSEDMHIRKVKKIQADWVLRLEESKSELQECEVTYASRIKELESKISEEVLLRRKLEMDVSCEKRYSRNMMVVGV